MNHQIKLNSLPAPKLRLYVWENVLADYTSGIAFALASSVDEARQLAYANLRKGMSPTWGTYQEELAKGDGAAQELSAEPQVFDSPAGFAISGGG
jgi:hypothetical protein